MSMVIQHNIPALQTYNIVNNTSNALQKSIAKLSSGLRINSAADDAAGLAISEKMRAQVSGLDRAVSNTQDGISLIQTAEGALQETHSILQRMRELAVQGANDTLTQQDRTYIQEEIDQLKDEITRIGNTTQFNKKKLINGESSALWSSSDSETKALIRGGLRDIDQFGQKSSVEGNYKIRVKAEPGQAEVQKSDIMTIKHPNVLTNKTVKADDGIKDVTVNNMTPGTYSLKLTDQTTTAGSAGKITGAYGVGGEVATDTEYQATYTAGNSAMVALGSEIAGGESKGYNVKIGDIDFGTLKVENTGTTAMDQAAIAKDLAGQIATAAEKQGITIDNENDALATFLKASDGTTTVTATAATKDLLGELSVTPSDASESSVVYTAGTNAMISSTHGGGNLNDQASRYFNVKIGSYDLGTLTVKNNTGNQMATQAIADNLSAQILNAAEEKGLKINATQDQLTHFLQATGTGTTHYPRAISVSGPGGTALNGTFSVKAGDTEVAMEGDTAVASAASTTPVDSSYTTTYTKGSGTALAAATNTWKVEIGGTDLGTTGSVDNADQAAAAIADKLAAGGYTVNVGELSTFLSDTTGNATLNVKSTEALGGGDLKISSVATPGTEVTSTGTGPTKTAADPTAVTASPTLTDTSATTTYTAGEEPMVDENATIAKATAPGTPTTKDFNVKIGNYSKTFTVSNDNTTTDMNQAAIAADLAKQIVEDAKGQGYVIDETELKDFLTAKDGTTTLEIKSSADKAEGTLVVSDGTTVATAEATSTKGADSTAKVAASDIFTVNSTANNTKNASILFEVTGKNEDSKSVTLKATATMLDQNGKVSSKTMDDIVVSGTGGAVNLSDIFGGSNATGEETVTVSLADGYLDAIDKGGMFVASVKAGVADADNTSGKGINVQLTSTKDADWPNAWDNGVFNGETPEYFLNGEKLSDLDVNFTNYILNEKTGEVSQGTVTLSTNKDFTTATGGALDNNKSVQNADTLASFTTSYIGKTATGDVKLRDLDKFWNSEGTFLLDDAKTLTLNQGDGKTASITLYANDTLDEVATKLNNAIADGLGQATYVDNATHFATFVSNASGDYDSEAVNGTFVIRSVVPGAQGEITFSGDENVLNALSLNTIQDSKETVYNVDVLDEHTGKLIAQNVKTTSNVMYGVIHDNVDVEFGALSGVSATWNEKMNKYTYDTETTESTLHIADNTTVLQIGANEGEDLAMDIGDMRTHALGIDGVNVMSHDRAGRAITLIDNAIDKVSTQRAKLGAYQNRLEYTASSLTTASENLTSAESRIRDADMAKEMMQFTKLNIMLQAGNSMLAQANQQPQNVLSLIR